MVLALVASIVAITQRSRAQASRREALVTTLEGRSLALRASQRDVAALLAVEAANRRPGRPVAVLIARHVHERPGLPWICRLRRQATSPQSADRARYK